MNSHIWIEQNNSFIKWTTIHIDNKIWHTFYFICVCAYVCLCECLCLDLCLKFIKERVKCNYSPVSLFLSRAFVYLNHKNKARATGENTEKKNTRKGKSVSIFMEQYCDHIWFNHILYRLKFLYVNKIQSVTSCAYADYRSFAHQTNWEHIVTMAIRIKSQVYTVIFSIILIVLDNWRSIAAQQLQQPQQQQQQTKGKILQTIYISKTQMNFPLCHLYEIEFCAFHLFVREIYAKQYIANDHDHQKFYITFISIKKHHLIYKLTISFTFHSVFINNNNNNHIETVNVRACVRVCVCINLGLAKFCEIFVRIFFFC